MIPNIKAAQATVILVWIVMGWLFFPTTVGCLMEIIDGKKDGKKGQG